MNLEKTLRARGKVMLTILVCAFVGCGNLSASRSSHVIYNEAQDEFGHLRVFRNIRVDRPKSKPETNVDPQKIKRSREEAIDYLISLWKIRSDVIMVPWLLDSGGESQFLYVGSREYKSIDLSERKDEEETQKSAVDLSKIIIRPGEFFASPQGSLCYFHCCYVPGRVVDEFLVPQTEVLNDWLLGSLLEEQKKRKEIKGIRKTWADLRGGEGISWWDVLDGESVRLLIHQASGRQMSLVRARDRIVVSFKLTVNDAAELETTKRFWDAKVKTRPANAKMTTEEAIAVQLINGLELKTGPNGTVTVNIHVRALFPVEMPNGQPDDVPETPEAAKARVAFLKETREDLATVESRGIPVSRSITFEKVLADFAKGRKK